MQQISKQIHHHIKQSKKIVVVPHRNPDGDALGSATAFFEYLEKNGKNGTLFCLTPLADYWHFLAHAFKTVSDPAIFNDSEIDTIVVLDSGDLNYAGINNFLTDSKASLINIDHHPANGRYGMLNLVVPGASSTTEVLYNFFRHNAIPVNQRMASSLLTGILTDTDNFRNAATSAEAMAIAGELLRLGGNINMIKTSVMKNKSVETLRLWGLALSRLTKHEELNLTYTYITQNDWQNYRLNENETEGIANFLNNLEETTKMSLVLKETDDGNVKGSLRTTRNDVDVSEIAKKLGGGGHKKAAGFTIKGTIDEALKKILTTQ